MHLLTQSSSGRKLDPEAGQVEPPPPWQQQKSLQSPAFFCRIVFYCSWYRAGNVAATAPRESSLWRCLVCTSGRLEGGGILGEIVRRTLKLIDGGDHRKSGGATVFDCHAVVWWIVFFRLSSSANQNTHSYMWPLQEHCHLGSRSSDDIMWDPIRAASFRFTQMIVLLVCWILQKLLSLGICRIADGCFC